MDRPRRFWDDWTDEQVARHFRYYTPAQLESCIRAAGLDIACTDEDTLRAAAAIQLTATARVTGQEVSVNRMDTLPPPRPRPVRSRMRRPRASRASTAG